MIEKQVTEAIQWIYESYTRVPAAERSGFDRDVRHPEWTRYLLDECGAPDKRAYNVAVTGSKGKGAHAILTAGILQAAGLRVGLFTSPHLVDFLERIRVNGDIIAGEQFVRLAHRVREVSEQAPLPNGQYIGPVGLIAVMASLCFQEANTDVNIFELGRGARHDDVNQVLHTGAIWTPMFAEHLDKLGPTWADVIDEKLGIVTADTKWVVSYAQQPLVLERWQNEDAAKRVTVQQLQRDFDYEFVPSTDAAVVRVQLGDMVHEARIHDTLRPFAANVAVALAAAARVMADLKGRSAALSVQLTELRLPGRLHLLRTRPTCLVDGTIHAVNAEFVVEWLKGKAQGGRIIAVCSLPDDKDAEGVIATLAAYCDAMYLTTSTNRHLHYTRDLMEIACRYGLNAHSEPDVDKVIEQVLGQANEQDTVLFLGTQSYVGDVLRIFQAPTQSIWRKD